MSQFVVEFSIEPSGVEQAELCEELHLLQTEDAHSLSTIFLPIARFCGTKAAMVILSAPNCTWLLASMLRTVYGLEARASRLAAKAIYRQLDRLSWRYRVVLLNSIRSYITVPRSMQLSVMGFVNPWPCSK